MEKFTILTGIAAPMLRRNVDTGSIIPTIWLRSNSFDLGQKAFHNWRYNLDGSENPDFILNQGNFRKAKILVAGPNFACGSSREGAVWALQRFGIRCVIAPSFGEIFFDNFFENGLLPVVVSEAHATRLGESLFRVADPTVTVDLERCVVETPEGETISFEVTADRRAALLQGLSETDFVLSHSQWVEDFQKRDAALRPWIYTRQGEGIRA